MAGFKSERVAGFNLECMAGFVGIRSHQLGQLRAIGTGAAHLFGEDLLRSCCSQRLDLPFVVLGF
jgi:hypothetical protein